MWDFIKGNIPILLVASHAHSHFRNGNLKLGDIGTGKIARNLAKSTGCWALVSTKIQNDPNWYTDSPFRVKVDDILKNENIKAVIDIHGRKDSSVLIKYYPNKYFIQKYTSLISNSRISSFKNNKQITITEHLTSLKIPGLEIEINKEGRFGNRTKELLDNLKSLILKVSSQ